MKKSVFTLLAIAFAVITMSSCSQDGGSSNDLNLSSSKVESQNKETKDYYGVRVVLHEELIDLGTYTITIQANGETKTYDINKDTVKKELSFDVKTNENTGNGYRYSSSGCVFDGYEFCKTVYSKTNDVKFSISFTPNADFKAPEDLENCRFLYDIEYVNSPSASITWADKYDGSFVEWTDAMAKAQNVFNQTSVAFTK